MRIEAQRSCETGRTVVEAQMDSARRSEVDAGVDGEGAAALSELAQECLGECRIGKESG